MGRGSNSFARMRILIWPIHGSTNELPKKSAAGGKRFSECVSTSLLPSIPYSIGPTRPMKGRSNQFPQSGNASWEWILCQNKPPNAENFKKEVTLKFYTFGACNLHRSANLPMCGERRLQFLARCCPLGLAPIENPNASLDLRQTPPFVEVVKCIKEDVTTEHCAWLCWWCENGH